MATRYNTAALRDLISAAITEDEFTALAFDYFRPVASSLPPGRRSASAYSFCSNTPSAADRWRDWLR